MALIIILRKKESKISKNERPDAYDNADVHIDLVSLAIFQSHFIL